MMADNPGSPQQGLQQLHIAYVPAQDRLLMRVTTAQQAEIRMWLTRRFVRILWPVLMEIIKTDPKVAATTGADSREAVMSFQREEALSQTKFTKQYQPPQQPQRPAGDVPLLLVDVSSEKLNAQQSTLKLRTARGREMQLTVGPKLVHSLCKLITDSLQHTEWGLDIAAGDGAETARPAPGRTIN